MKNNLNVLENSDNYDNEPMRQRRLLSVGISNLYRNDVLDYRITCLFNYILHSTMKSIESCIMPFYSCPILINSTDCTQSQLCTLLYLQVKFVLKLLVFIFAFVVRKYQICVKKNFLNKNNKHNFQVLNSDK